MVHRVFAALPGHNVGNQTDITRGRILRNDDAFADGWVLFENTLDLAQFDAMSANLDLIIKASKKVDLAGGKPARQVARAVETLFSSPKGSLDEPLSGQLRTRKVTTRDPIATDQQLARHAEGNLPQAAIHNVDPRVRNRSPDGDG